MILWHPILTQLLREEFPDELVIEDEVPLSEAPLRADLVLIRTRTEQVLPYPFDLLGQQTLAEFSSFLPI